ncbi:MAG: MlaD family protein [Rhodothermales bacterium]
MSRQTRVGIIVIGGISLFLLALFMIANRSFLFSDTFPLRARYASVAGLNAGAQVQFQGVNVGRVENVALPERPGERITVTMAIKRDAQHLITEDTQAQIKTDGLVGSQIVVLVNPPLALAMDPVGENDIITGIEPFDLYEITDRMLSTVAQFDSAAATFQQIMVDVQTGEGTLGRLVYDESLYDEFVATTNSTRETMNNLADNAGALVELAGNATEGVNSILNKIDQGEGTFAMMLNDPAVYNTLLATADTLQGISADLRGITSSAENAANWGALGSFRFAELMEAAKHNWLFKRYFEERGYMEKAPFEERERALAQSFQELQRQRRELLEWQRQLEALEARLQDAGVEMSADTTRSRTENPSQTASSNE